MKYFNSFLFFLNISVTKNKKTTKNNRTFFAIFQYTRLCLISFLSLHFITFLSFLLVSFKFAEFTS